jgi:CRISPR-associated endonuclease Csn1
MMKKILGLDLGTNSIGWALVKQNFEKKEGKIIDVGSRIIPMDQGQLTDFESGNSISATADRTKYRGTRRLYQRDNMRRERLHRVLKILGFLPQHYKDKIDFNKKKGQFIDEVKLNYRKNGSGKHEFIFMDSFNKMVKEFKAKGIDKTPYDWTIYYLRKKALKEKISKEELAWVILNFNQKRGYYQLRGDELSNQDEGKDERFYALKVIEVKETENKNANGVWYEVILEPGYGNENWIYKRQSKEPLNNWVGLIKEFIVTTKKDKEGNLKRSFRAPKEDDWGLVKKKTEQELETHINNNPKNNSVATFIYQKLLENPTQKINGKLIKVIERKFYKQELETILDTQIKEHNELQNDDLYNTCVEELYPKNEAHKNSLLSNKNKFKHLFVEDIIFYQRPLKSQKGNISGCQYEKRPTRDKDGKLIKDDKGKTVLLPVKVTSKSHPLFQEFRLWQWLHNLKIYQNKKEVSGKTIIDADVTNELLTDEKAWTDLFDFLTTKREIDLAGFLKYFSDKKLIDKQKKDNYTHRWNYPEDKKYPMYETRNSILSILKKVENLSNINKFLTPEIEKHLWHIIYSVSDAQEFEKALGKFAEKYGLDKNSFVDNFKKIAPYKSDYAAYSEKAIKKLLPLMRMGKYWNEKNIPDEIKTRIEDIMLRVNELHLPEKPTQKQIKEAFEKHQVTDDDINKQLIKSFIPFINKNPLKGLNTYQAGYAVYGRHSETSEITTWKNPQDIDKYLNAFKQHSLRNPIVEKIVLETLRTVRDIWQHYGNGEEGFFDEIHLELGRELKNPADKRKKISQRNTENEKTNQRIRLLLQELINDGARPNSPSHQEILKIYEEGVFLNPNLKYDKLSEDDVKKIRDNKSPSKKNSVPTIADIQKYKLWLEQKYISPYTGKHISLSDLFSEKYQIEHIIPQSRYFDNSMSNKVICESNVNQEKGNQTAYEFIKGKGGSKVDLGEGKTVDLLKWEDYKAHCEHYFKKNRAKLKNLLAEEIPEGFINRQLNDSRYISKLVKSLLSNIVRKDGEQEPTAKKLLPITGAITSQLKKDWGLNDKWNRLILPRFQRLNKLTNSHDFTFKKDNGIEVPTVPDDLKYGFNKKRIDHRHHALDALVIACCTRKHIQYINSLNNEKVKYDLQPSLMIKNEQGDFTKHFQLPWKNFPADALKTLETTIVSFKKNTRVLTKTNNKYWKYKQQKDGTYKKELVKQKGDNRAIRKPLHKETVSGKLQWKASKGKIYTAVRANLSEIKNRKHWEKITDSGIKTILDNHLKNYVDEKGKEDFKKAFSPEGIEELNKNIVALNKGKFHQPIYKVRLYEESSKFPVSESTNSSKNKKYVEAAKGTNLFFNIYKNEKGERVYETVPLNEVIAHQKWRTTLTKKEREKTPMVPVKNILKNKTVTFLFTLSPGDLVYVPTDEEMENPNSVDFNNLTKEQVTRIFVVNDFSTAIYFTPINLAKNIAPKEVDLSFDRKTNKLKGSFDTKTASYKDIQIKDICWKLEVDRLGNIINVQQT